MEFVLPSTVPLPPHEISAHRLPASGLLPVSFPRHPETAAALHPSLPATCSRSVGASDPVDPATVRPPCRAAPYGSLRGPPPVVVLAAKDRLHFRLPHPVFDSLCPGWNLNLRAILHQGLRVGLEEHVQRSNYRAFVLPDECTACGVCITRCPVDAISEQDDCIAFVHREKCIGCGVCVIGCAFDALELQTVSEEEWFYTPASMDEWEEMRLKNMAADK